MGKVRFLWEDPSVVGKACFFVGGSEYCGKCVFCGMIRVSWEKRGKCVGKVWDDPSIVGKVLEDPSVVGKVWESCGKSLLIVGKVR